MKAQHRPDTQAGIALVIVLWVLALLTIMAGAYSAVMRTETRLTTRQFYSAQSRALAEAGVWLAVNELLKPDLGRTWLADGRDYETAFHHGNIRISMQDESGKIDLNTARAELMQGLLVATGNSEADSISLLQSIMDWRDRDDLRRTAGAEDRDYHLAGLDYGAKDGPFNSVDELRMVLGVSAELFRALKPALTVYSHQPGINPALAPREVLLALPGTDAEQVDEFLAARNADPQAGEQLGLAGANNRFMTQMKNGVVTITSMGITAENQVILTVTVMLNRNAEDPYSILSWREI
jgi:general secretion pathway protein K